jgi:hypothetical protein
MPDGSKVEFVGTDQAAADIARWAKQVGPELDKRSRDLAESIRDTTQGRVPVLTGNLADSVEVVDVSGDAEGSGWGVAIGDGVDYAGWIEFGGSRGRELVPEGRYLYPTAQEAEDEYARLAEEIATDTAEGFPWSTPAA